MDGQGHRRGNGLSTHVRSVEAGGRTARSRVMRANIPGAYARQLPPQKASCVAGAGGAGAVRARRLAHRVRPRQANPAALPLAHAVRVLECFAIAGLTADRPHHAAGRGVCKLLYIRQARNWLANNHASARASAEEGCAWDVAGGRNTVKASGFAAGMIGACPKSSRTSSSRRSRPRPCQGPSARPRRLRVFS